MKIKGKDVLGLVGAISATCIYFAPIVVIEYVVVDFVFDRFQLLLQSTLIAAALCLLASIIYVCLTTAMGVMLESSGESHEESEPKLEAIASNRGSNLNEVAEAIRNEKLEYLAYFSLNGEKLAEGTYLLPDQCNITTKDWHSIYARGEEVMKVHNHPGHSDVAFSAQDFKAFLCQDFIRRTVVVTKNYNFIMEKVGNGYEDLQNDAKAYVERMDIKYIWLAIFSSRLWSVIVARKAAENFGLKFMVERINYSPVRKCIFAGLALCSVIASLGLFKPQFFNYSASATASAQDSSNASDDGIITVTEAQLANEVSCGAIDPPM